MPFVTYPQQILGFTIKNRLGRPMQFGWIMFGWSHFGEDNVYIGTYQQRHKRKNYWQYNRDAFLGIIMFGRDQFGSEHLFGLNKSKRKTNFIMRPYWPVDTQSPARTAQRSKFTTALRMWQNLTQSDKEAYNKLAAKLPKRGYDIFMSKTLKSL